MIRKNKFAVGEIYHIFNRGVDKRQIFLNKPDSVRFIKSVKYFNNIENLGSLYERSFIKSNKNTSKQVSIISYCLNSNHFHLLIKEITEGGVSSYMKKLGGGYSWYFNNKYKRSGALFQGPFKSVHVKSNEQLLQLSAYVNLNHKVHQLLGHLVAKWGLRSSWDEYVKEISKEDEVCEKDIILDQFKNKKEYKKFAEETVKEIIKQRKEDKELDQILID